MLARRFGSIPARRRSRRCSSARTETAWATWPKSGYGAASGGTGPCAALSLTRRRPGTSAPATKIASSPAGGRRAGPASASRRFWTARSAATAARCGGNCHKPRSPRHRCRFASGQAPSTKSQAVTTLGKTRVSETCLSSTRDLLTETYFQTVNPRSDRLCRPCHHTRMGIRTYSAGLASFSRISVGAAASARCSSTRSLSIWPNMSSR